MSTFSDTLYFISSFFKGKGSTNSPEGGDSILAWKRIIDIPKIGGKSTRQWRRYVLSIYILLKWHPAILNASTSNWWGVVLGGFFLQKIHWRLKKNLFLSKYSSKQSWTKCTKRFKIKASLRLRQDATQTNRSRPKETSSGLESQPSSGQTIDSSCTETSPFIWTPKRPLSRASISQQLKQTYTTCSQHYSCTSVHLQYDRVLHQRRDCSEVKAVTGRTNKHTPHLLQSTVHSVSPG